MAENSEKNTTQQSNVVHTLITGGEEVQSDLLASNGQLEDVLDREEIQIAAHSLILSALGGSLNQKQNVQLQEEVVVPRTVVIPQSQNIAQTTNIALATVQTKGNGSTSDDLAFDDVSQAIGVEMIAVQQQANVAYRDQHMQENNILQNKENGNSTQFINNQLSGDETLLNAALATATNTTVVVIKDENGEAEIRFEGAESGEEIQLSQTESLTIDENAINGLAGNEIELPTGDQRYPKLFSATTAQEAHEIIKKYAEETMSTFVSMRKMKQYGITG